MECKKSAELIDCKVSIIVPVYNVEEYLGECVDSLLGQTLKDIEILLIDDGSTDSSGAMCDKYAAEHANVIVVHKINGGLGDARNAGTRIARGKYIYFIDSDDFLENCALECLYDEAEKKSLDVILFSAECFSDEDKLLFDKEQYRRTCFLNEVMSGKSLFEKLYSAREYYASIPLRFYNRRYFIENGYIFPSVIHEDEFLGFQSLIDANRAECIGFKFYKRRFRSGSIMTSGKAYNSAVGYVYTWKNLMNTYHKMNLEDKSVYYGFSEGFLKLIINSYYSSFDKNEKKRFKKIRYELLEFINSKNGRTSRGIKLFLISPAIYKYYKRVIKVFN